MKEKLQEYALIAEIVGAVTIVVSLLFVGFQLHENTMATRSATASAASATTSAWYTALGTSEQSSALFFQFINDPDALTPEQRMQAVFAIHGVIINFQTSFMLAEQGTLDPQIKDTILEALVVVKDKPGWIYFWEQRKPFFFEEFQAYVEELTNVERTTSNDIFSYRNKQ